MRMQQSLMGQVRKLAGQWLMWWLSGKADAQACPWPSTTLPASFTVQHLVFCSPSNKFSYWWSREELLGWVDKQVTMQELSSAFLLLWVLKPKTQNPKPFILRKSVDTAEEIILCLLVVSAIFLIRYSYFAGTWNKLISGCCRMDGFRNKVQFELQQQQVFSLCFPALVSLL
jgi:hypothetical protein